MKRLITVVLLIACNFIVILPQEPDKTPSPNRPSVSRLPLTPPDFIFGKSLNRDSTILPAGQPTKLHPDIPSNTTDAIDSPFVVRNGAVYMTMLNGRYLIPVPGGGASGCFSLDLPRRITNLQEFVPRLAAPEQVDVKRNGAH